MVNNGVDTGKYVALRKSIEAEREKNMTQIRTLKKLLDHNDAVGHAVARDIDESAMLGGRLNHRLIEAAEQVKISGRRVESDVSGEMDTLQRKNQRLEEDLADVEKRFHREQLRVRGEEKKEGQK